MTHELTGDGLRDFTIFGFVTEWRRVALDLPWGGRFGFARVLEA
jgi:hypothetical protein